MNVKQMFMCSAAIERWSRAVKTGDGENATVGNDTVANEYLIR